MKKVPSIRDYARKGINSPGEHDPWEITLRRSVNLQIAFPKGGSTKCFTHEGVQSVDCSHRNNLPWIAPRRLICPFGQSRMDYALIYCATNGSKITKGFTPEGVRATDCSLENNLPWIANQDTERTRHPASEAGISTCSASAYIAGSSSEPEEGDRRTATVEESDCIGREGQSSRSELRDDCIRHCATEGSKT